MCFTWWYGQNSIGPDFTSDTQSIFSSKIQTKNILSSKAEHCQEYVVHIFKIKKNEVLLNPISLNNDACIDKRLQSDGLLATIFFDREEKKMCLKVHPNKKILLPTKKFKMEVQDSYTRLTLNCEKIEVLTDQEYSILERIHDQFLEARVPTS